MSQEDALHLLLGVGLQVRRVIDTTKAHRLAAGAQLRQQRVIGGSRKSQGEKTCGREI